MSSIPLPSLSTISGFETDKPLGDPSLPSSPVSLAAPTQSTTVNVPDPSNTGVNLGSFVISCGAQTCVAIVNSSSDPDPIGYFNMGCSAQPAAEDPANAPAIEPPINYDPSLAYVVITGLSVTGKVAGTFTIGGPAALGLDGSLALDAGACMAFPRNAMARASLAAAAANFRTLFSIDELLAPAPAPSPPVAQVLSFGIQGSLCLSLKLTASSLASTIADSVGAVLNLAGPFSFTASPSATLTVSVGASDGFRIFAQKTAGAATLFSVKKSVSTSLGLNAGVGLKVAVADSDLNDLVDSVFDQLAGAAGGTVRSILNAASGTATGLGPAEQQALLGVLSKLGIPATASGAVQSLQAKLASFESDLTQRLENVVCAQFTYSWQRVTTDSLAAQFTVPDAVLRKYHAGILCLDLTRLMTAGSADGVVFSRLLGQEIEAIDVGYGFSFGVGGYTFLKSWDSLQLKFVELNSTGNDGGSLRQFSFLGKRAYAVSWLQSTQENFVELDAATTVPLASPDASDFQVRLSVAFSWKGCSFKDIVNTVADHGAVISALDSDDVAVSSNAFVAAGLPLDATGDALVSLAIPDAVLRQVLPALTKADFLQTIAPYAMARALPFFPPFAERAQVDIRTGAYAQVFADFLATPSGNLGTDTVAKLCEHYLQQTDAGLASSEANANVGWTAQSVVSEASQDDLLDAVVTRAPGCFSLLQSRVGDFHAVFPSCVSDFSELAAQGYGTRVFASMLILAASVNPVWLGRIPRSVQFSWRDGTGSHTIVAKQGT
ncbi:MAG TPA: hypothetical protein VN775_08540 [Opitutaceae bacterium]|nr:hypothetical protein [Opitutaceae bacterium]